MLRQNLVSSGGAPNATELKQLIQQARDLELTDLELDGLVYDLTDNNRSIVYNSGDPITGDDYEDLDLLDETSGEIASAINNQGLEEQVAFIATELGVKDASTALNELAA